MSLRTSFLLKKCGVMAGISVAQTPQKSSESSRFLFARRGEHEIEFQYLAILCDIWF